MVRMVACVSGGCDTRKTMKSRKYFMVGDVCKTFWNPTQSKVIKYMHNINGHLPSHTSCPADSGTAGPEAGGGC